MSTSQITRSVSAAQKLNRDPRLSTNGRTTRPSTTRLRPPPTNLDPTTPSRCAGVDFQDLMEEQEVPGRCDAGRRGQRRIGGHAERRLLERRQRDHEHQRARAQHRKPHREVGEERNPRLVHLHRARARATERITKKTCAAMTSVTVAGSTPTWKPNAWCSVQLLTSWPPRRKRSRNCPMSGVSPAILLLTRRLEVRVLVPGQDRAGEGHADAEPQQEQPAQPHQLPRRRKAPEKHHQENLRCQNQHEQVARPQMHAANKAAVWNAPHDVQNGGVRPCRRRPIGQKQQDAAHDLDQEQEQEQAAEVMSRRVPGNEALLESVAQGTCAQSFRKPLADASRDHGGLKPG